MSASYNTRAMRRVLPAAALLLAHAASAATWPWQNRRLEPWEQPKPWDQQASGNSAASIGGRAAYIRPRELSGAWGWGGQLKLPMGGAAAAEVSVDRALLAGPGGDYTIMPIQATVLGYLSGESSLKPYALLGIGWYRLATPTGRDTLNFPHAGAGLELAPGTGAWSIDGSLRVGFSAVYKPFGGTKPWGENWRRRGHLWTVGLNRRF